MASIVYDGVPGNGDLFAGIKFFIMQRVPLRHTWVENIKSNGGEVVPLENQADMLIADRARPKMAPPNSFTWHYIEDSLKSGVLQDKENYRIHSVSTSHASPMARTTGNVFGGSRPNKTTRTPYTQADDDFLLQWVAKAQQRGMALLGKKIYEQLATVNPRHTAQSWQDRYKKQHQGKQLPEVSLDGPAPVDEPEDGQYSRPLGSRQVDGVDHGSRRVPELVRRQLSRSQQTSRQVDEAEDDQDDDEDEERHPPVVERFARHAPKVVGGQEFSQADHDLLASEYEAILDIERKGKSVIQAWSGFSKGHGRHTADEWYNYFQTTVKPQMEKKLRKAVESKKTKSPAIAIEEDDEEDVEEQPSLGKKPPHSAASKKSNSGHRATEEYEGRNERGELMFLESDRDTEDGHQADGDEDMEAMDLGMSQLRDDELPVPVLRTKSPNVSSVPKSSALRKPISISKQSRDFANDKRDESVPEDKAAFLEDLRTVARATHKQIEPRQEVCGIQIQLYDLWNAVNNKFEGFEDVDADDMWGRVATHLGFNISKHPGVAKELRNLYTAFLVKVLGTGALSGINAPKTALAKVHPSTGKSHKPVTALSASTPGASLPSRTAPTRTTAVKSQAKNTPASPRDTSNPLQPRRVAKLDSLTDNANAGITIRSLPELTASTASASAEADTRESAAPVDDLEPAESQVPMQLETGNGYVESSKEYVEGADEENFKEADWVMLAKLVDFAKDSLNMNIQRTGSAICGRWVSLPKFRKVVNKFGGYKTVTRKKLWKQVSFDLGYLPVNKYPGVAKELQEAYEEVLEDYDEYRKRVREVRRSSGRQELQSLSDEDSGIAVPRTSPRQGGSVSSQKRGRNPSKDDSPAKVADTFKRRRVDRKGKGKEIGSEVPGTPEHIYNSRMLSQEASVVKDSQIIELSSDWDSDGTEAFQPIKRSLFQKAAAPPESVAADEPETQEFSFIEEESPSRQLNSEAMASESCGDPVVIEYFEMCDSEGHSRDVAQLALAAANMNTVLASKILSRVARGRIPDNISGVWTAKDDDTLLMDLPIDHPEMKKLIKKHGSDGIEERREFLDELGEYAADG